MQGAKDMVFFKKEGKILSGGMKINSLLLEQQTPLTVIKTTQKCNPLMNTTNESVIPAGLILLNNHAKHRMGMNRGIKQESNVISEKMYDKLFDINEQMQTRKHAHKSTRKKHEKKRKSSSKTKGRKK